MTRALAAILALALPIPALADTFAADYAVLSQAHPEAHRAPTCPDQAGTALWASTAPQPGSGGANGGQPQWAPTGCEQAVLGAAIGQCLSKVHGGNGAASIVATLTNVIALGGIFATFGGAAAVAAGGKSSAIDATVAGAAATGLADSKYVNGGSAATVAITSLEANAAAYAQYTASRWAVPAMPVADPRADPVRAFYAGLWDATGAACPSSPFASFRMARIDKRALGNEWMMAR